MKLFEKKVLSNPEEENAVCVTIAVKDSKVSIDTFKKGIGKAQKNVYFSGIWVCFIKL